MPCARPSKSATERWAPDGRAVTFRNRANAAWNVYRCPFDGGPPTAVTRFTQGRVTDHLWSPDGRKLAVRVDDGDASNLWIVEADGSRPVQATQFASESVFDYAWMADSRRLVVCAGTRTSDAVLIRDFR